MSMNYFVVTFRLFSESRNFSLTPLVLFCQRESHESFLSCIITIVLQLVTLFYPLPRASTANTANNFCSKWSLSSCSFRMTAKGFRMACRTLCEPILFRPHWNILASSPTPLGSPLPFLIDFLAVLGAHWVFPASAPVNSPFLLADTLSPQTSAWLASLPSLAFPFMLQPTSYTPAPSPVLFFSLAL